jgi:hypothetical protein
VKIKTSELIGPALDWAVEVANGTHWSANGYFVFRYEGCGPNGFVSKNPQWSYSTEWSQGGPIIERERIETRHDGRKSWCAWIESTGAVHGPTPLIAAMRCYVTNKLGDEVNVPDELQ